MKTKTKPNASLPTPSTAAELIALLRRLGPVGDGSLATLAAAALAPQAFANLRYSDRRPYFLFSAEGGSDALDVARKFAAAAGESVELFSSRALVTTPTGQARLEDRVFATATFLSRSAKPELPGSVLVYGLRDAVDTTSLFNAQPGHWLHRHHHDKHAGFELSSLPNRALWLGAGESLQPSPRLCESSLLAHLTPTTLEEREAVSPLQIRALAARIWSEARLNHNRSSTEHGPLAASRRVLEQGMCAMGLELSFDGDAAQVHRDDPLQQFVENCGHSLPSPFSARLALRVARGARVVPEHVAGAMSEPAAVKRMATFLRDHDGETRAGFRVVADKPSAKSPLQFRLEAVADANEEE